VSILPTQLTEPHPKAFAPPSRFGRGEAKAGEDDQEWPDHDRTSTSIDRPERRQRPLRLRRVYEKKRPAQQKIAGRRAPPIYSTTESPRPIMNH